MGETSSRLMVFFDGDCGLCHRWVRFLAPRDKEGLLEFAPLSGPTSSAVFARHPSLADRPDSVVVVSGLGTDMEKVHFRSNAALMAWSVIGPGWKLLAMVARIVPRILRDHIYDMIAKRRLQWFGRADICAMKTEPWAGKVRE